jgi:predicted DCC family thiol-disulfide oxidoreductase YuxK
MNKEEAIILFDGICNLCNNSVSFILKRDKKQQFRFVALQSEEGKEFIEKHAIPKETDSIIFIQNNKVFIESTAAIEISKRLPFPWKWAVVFGIIPKKWRDLIYRWIAKNRYRWFGKKERICNVADETTEYFL